MKSDNFEGLRQTNSIITSRLKPLIDNSGKTNNDIAVAIGCDKSLVTKHYNGDKTISLDFIIKYAKYFNVSTDYLLGLTNTASNNEDIQTLCKKIPLSEDSASILFNMDNPEILLFLSDFLKCDKGLQLNFATSYFNYLHGQMIKQNLAMLNDNTIKDLQNKKKNITINLGVNDEKFPEMNILDIPDFTEYAFARALIKLFESKSNETDNKSKTSKRKKGGNKNSKHN
ncbi:MAG: helix-turn-helix transcriptional regulator [Clostridia bacterium]|nr:helix-turn-helix transcriptional regulator [Clostridia bacterium]